MTAIQTIVTVVRIALAAVFIAVAGVLALLADGIGRIGWSVAGQPRPEPAQAAHSDLDLKLRAHLISA